MPTTEPAVQEPVAKEPATAVQQKEELDPLQQLLAQKEQEHKEKAQKEKAVSANKPAAATAPSGARYLQAGVFRNKTEAEKLRNKMSRLGVSTSVRVISDANGAALQKVLAGPFRSSAEADNARTILSGNGISTIAVK
jgi:cell division protein FtsN